MIEQEEKSQVIEAEFIVSRFYKVTADISGIDRYLDEVIFSDPQDKDKERTVCHRMFQAIVSNKEALDAILEYETLLENALESDTTYGFIESRYNDEEYGFEDILTKFAHIFAPEDKDYGCLDYLEKGFQAKPNAWDIQEHLCERKARPV